jgi:hypothetical protein
MKSSSDTIGDRTRDLPACGAVPKATAPRRAVKPKHVEDVIIYMLNDRFAIGQKHTYLYVVQFGCDQLQFYPSA